MKVQCEGKDIFTLSEIQIKVIRNDIKDEDFQDEMERRLADALISKYEACLQRLIKDWEPKIKARFASIPSDKDALAEVIFSQPDYKTRTQRERDLKNS